MSAPYQRPRLPSQLTYNDLNGQEATEIMVDWFRQLLKSQPLLQPHLTLPMARITLDLNIQVEMYVGGTVPVASAPDTLTIDGTVTLENKVLSTVVNAAPVAGGSPPDKIREQHSLAIPGPGYGPRETGSHLFLADGQVQTTAKPINEASLLDKIADDHAHTSERGSEHTLSERSEPDGVSRMASGPSTGGRVGVVADGYVFSTEPVNVSPVEQHIELGRANKGIDIDLTGQGRMKQGDMTVTAGSHFASKKVAGDQAGQEYGSVGATYDLGPAGLARPGAGGGLYRDGRPRISYGNNNKG